VGSLHLAPAAVASWRCVLGSSVDVGSAPPPVRRRPSAGYGVRPRSRTSPWVPRARLVLAVVRRAPGLLHGGGPGAAALW